VIISTLASPYLTISWNLTTYSTEGAWVGVTDSKGQPRSNTKGNQVNVHRVNHSQFSSQTCSQVTKVSSTAALANLIYFWFKRWGKQDEVPLEVELKSKYWILGKWRTLSFSLETPSIWSIRSSNSFFARTLYAIIKAEGHHPLRRS